ncbi:MAG: phosphate signaling complex protein PhoU [Planctomycetales bacterium]|nr:phosphate signaling complex protein PhoU [Planctomycetales bacterium]
MSKHLADDMNQAYHRLLAMSGEVENMINLAVLSLMDRNIETAQRVILLDEEIDRTEVSIEAECLKMLALHQPVAADLRRLTTMMKVNNDLERMADLACNIAERASCLVAVADFPIPERIRDMAEEVVLMVRTSLRSFINYDTTLAQEVIEKDNHVDSANVDVIDRLIEVIQENSFWTEPALHCFSASRQLEQIADHATAVAEDVIYMVSGVISRHQHQAPHARN